MDCDKLLLTKSGRRRIISTICRRAFTKSSLFITEQCYNLLLFFCLGKRSGLQSEMTFTLNRCQKKNKMRVNILFLIWFPWKSYKILTKHDKSSLICKKKCINLHLFITLEISTPSLYLSHTTWKAQQNCEKIRKAFRNRKPE